MESVNMFKAGLVCHREDDEEAVSCPHVLLPHRAELLLSGCVQHYWDRWTQMHYFTRVSLKAGDRAFALLAPMRWNYPQLCFSESFKQLIGKPSYRSIYLSSYIFSSSSGKWFIISHCPTWFNLTDNKKLIKHAKTWPFKATIKSQSYSKY